MATQTAAKTQSNIGITEVVLPGDEESLGLILPMLAHLSPPAPTVGSPGLPQRRAPGNVGGLWL